MPELARFFGIIIRMYAEPFAPHHRSHFHAYYQESAAIYDLATLDLLAGSLPLRQQRLVQAWAELHHDELLEDWNWLQQGRHPNPILPLQ
jgi:hypothetical protein